MDKKGFTLIEVVVASVILVIVFTTLTQIVVFSTIYFKDEYSESVSQEDLRLSALLIEKDIRRYVVDIDYYARAITETSVTITLGNTSNHTNYAVYTFNISDSTITRTLYDPDDVVISSQITSQQIQDFDILLDITDINSPYLLVDIIAIPDARVTNNDIYQTIYLRLPETN